MSNYSFVVNSGFKPFSFQEMLIPFEYYRQAFDKAEEQYNDLSDKANAFKYLSETLPEDSKARQIYEGYANGFNEQAEDFAQNGLTMTNGSALSSYRKRYAGEIGRLVKADEALRKEIERRNTLDANDPTRIYSTNDLNIDQFLDRKNPNMYSVSGNALYQRGLQIGAADSARIWSNPKVQALNKYYDNVVSTNGRKPEILAAWRRDLASIPELQDSLNATLKEFDVPNNLKGAAYERAKEAVINGIMNGATYKRADNTIQNLGVLTAAQEEQKREWGLEFDEKKREYNNSYGLSKQELQLKQDAATAAANKTTSEANNTPKFKNPVVLEFNGESPLKNGDRYKDGANVTSSEISDVDDVPSGQLMSYEELPTTVRDNVKRAISGRGKPTDYHYNWIHSTTFRDAKVVIIPNETSTTDFGSTGSVDIH